MRSNCLPAVDQEPVFRRFRVPAARNHDRERHLPDRPDGLGGRPDACCLRGGSPPRCRRVCRRCGRRCARSPHTCRTTALRMATSSPPTSSCESPTDLKLIDYDGMYVPQLAGRSSAELGQRNFQHPGGGRPLRREPRPVFVHVDRSRARCDRQASHLWDQTDSGADAFILRAVDFADPANSPAFRLLASVPGLEPRVTHFAACCRSPYEQVPAFEDFLAARNIPAVPIQFSGDASHALRDRYVSIHEVVDASNFARCCTRVGDSVERSA